MPRPKKDGISEEVGNIPVTRKRGNPDFKVSSYYIPAGLNLKFDRAVLALKAAGFDIDRSDILAALISRFVHQVDVAEQVSDAETGLNLEAILDAAGEGSVGETAEVSALKTQLKTTISAAEKAGDDYQNASTTLSNGEDLEQRFSKIESQMSDAMNLLKQLVDQQG